MLQALAEPILALTCHARFVRQFLRVERPGGPRSGIAPQRLQCAAIGNADNPSGDQGLAPEVSGLLPYDPKGVVGGFLDNLRTPRQSAEEAVQPPKLPAIKVFEGATVPGRDQA